jgi:hypothetical protein
VRIALPPFVVCVANDDRGQDLVEYALLTAFFGLLLASLWTSIADVLGVRYGRTQSGVQGLWAMPAPESVQP